MPAKKSSAEKAPDAGPGGVMAIRLVLQILELLGKRQTVGVTELANALGTTKARVFRHLRTLADTGFAEQDPGTERYMAGPRLIGLARLAGLTPDEGIIRLARPAMMRLRDRFGHTVNLSLVYGESASILETLQGTSFVDVVMQTHAPMPLHSTAAGKLLLAELLAQKGSVPEAPCEAFTEHTIVDPAALRTELERVAAQGWAAAPEETVLGINALSAPVRDHNGVLVAMISLVGSIQHVTREAPREMIAAVTLAADEITAALSLP